MIDEDDDTAPLCDSWPKAFAYAAKWISIAIIICAFAYCSSHGG